MVMPSTRQGVEAVIDRLGWRGQGAQARRRAGRGGGWEYSWALFSDRAKQRLLGAVAPAPEPAKPAFADRTEAWSLFEKLRDAVKDKARSRLVLLQQVEALEPVQAMWRHVAVQAVARANGV